jgi:signal transduction histidine kinase
MAPPATGSCRRGSPTRSSTPGRRARVTIRYAGSRLDLEIADDGRGTTASDDGGGHGLAGMRERVGLFGGTLQAGPRDEGGYALHATLPLGPGRP